MTEFSVNIPMTPVPKGRPRFTRTGHAFTDPKTRKAEADIQIACRKAWHLEPMECPVIVEAEFYFAKSKTNKTSHHVQRPDADNCLKLLTDAMNGIVFKDDSQIVRAVTSKFWADDGIPMVCVRVYPKE